MSRLLSGVLTVALGYGLAVALSSSPPFMAAWTVPAQSCPTFLVTPAYRSGPSPRDLAIGDFNHDGRGDLAVANYGSGSVFGSVSVFLAKPDGTFLAPVSYPIGSLSVTTGDFNGDGNIDLALGGSSAILLGRGDGTFVAGATFGSNSSNVTVADFNADGKADLAVPIDSANTVNVLLGRGDGTFAAPTSYAVGKLPHSVAAGDFNGDGRVDMVVGNQDSPFVSVLLNSGAGAFSPAQSFAAGAGSFFVRVGELNSDGKIDIVVAGFGTTVLTLRGNGDGTFQPATTTAIGRSAANVVIGDFNGDSKSDLAVADGNSLVSILLGRGDGNFVDTFTYSSGGFNTRGLAIGDLNNDGRLDLVASNINSDNVGVLIGSGDGTFAAQRHYKLSYAYSISVADFDKDGVADLLAGGVALLGRAGGTFSPVQAPPMGAPLSTAVADFNGDGYPDFADIFGSIQIWLGSHDGSFAKGKALTGGSGAGFGATGDLNNDGFADLITVNNTDLSVFLGHGDGTFVTAPSIALAASHVQLADLNHDGKLDIVAARRAVPGISVLLGNGNGTFAAPVVYGTSGFGAGAAQVAIGDFNSDGNLDVVDVGYGAKVLLNQGNGTFGTATEYAQSVFPYSIAGVALGDLDGDGVLDLVLTGRVDQAGAEGTLVLLGTGSGAFQTGPPIFVSPTGALVVGDFDRDGNLDMAAASNTTDSVAVFLNQGCPQPFGAPRNLLASATSNSTVAVSWSSVSGAVSYRVLRSANNQAFVLVGTSGSAQFTDSTVSPNTTYIYEVQAVDSQGGVSLPSGIDTATTVQFVDDPLVTGVTPIKAVHLQQVQVAVNAFRASAGLPAAVFSNSALIRAADIAELRTALAEARAVLGLPPIVYTDSGLVAGSTLVKAAHVQEIRNAVR